MGKMSELHMEIEDLLRQGFDTNTIATMLQCPLQFVLDMEENLMALADPRFYGPDADQ